MPPPARLTQPLALTLALILAPAWAQPAAQPAPGSSPAPKSPRAALPEPLTLGELDANTFERYIARGPQPFMASLRVLPARKGGAFVGFRLAQVAEGSPAALGGLRVGDVVRRVNGLPIGRPEEWMRAWALVREQRRVEVELERDGVLHRWVWGVRAAP